MKDNALKDTALSFKMPPIAVRQPESGLRNSKSSTSSTSPLALAPKSAATLDPLADIDPLTNNLPFAARMLFALVGFALNPPKGPSFYATWYHSRLGNKAAMCLSLVAVLLSAMNGPGTLLGAHILNIWCLNLIPTSFFTLCHLARIWQAVYVSKISLVAPNRLTLTFLSMTASGTRLARLTTSSTFASQLLATLALRGTSLLSCGSASSYAGSYLFTTTCI